MTDELREYRKRLEKAINEALAESSHINSIIQDVRRSGFDVFMIIEATVGFNQLDAGSESEEIKTSVQLDLTSQDERFLRQLKISPD